MAEAITYVGMDAHKKMIAVAMLVPGEKKAVEFEIKNTASEIKKLAAMPTDSFSRTICMPLN